MQVPILDLSRVHRAIIDQAQKTWYVQNGYVYDVHGNVLGKANDLKAFTPKHYFFCHYDCANTYTKREQLEKHIFEDHRDLCIHSIPQPEGMKAGYFQPTEEAIQIAAKELADQVKADPAPFIAPQATLPGIEAPRRGRPKSEPKAEVGDPL